MRELGSTKSYTAQQCEAQLQYLDSHREQSDISLPRLPGSQQTRRRAMIKAPRGISRVTTA